MEGGWDTGILNRSTWKDPDEADDMESLNSGESLLFVGELSPSPAKGRNAPMPTKAGVASMEAGAIQNNAVSGPDFTSLLDP